MIPPRLLQHRWGWSRITVCTGWVSQKQKPTPRCSSQRSFSSQPPESKKKPVTERDRKNFLKKIPRDAWQARAIDTLRRRRRRVFIFSFSSNRKVSYKSIQHSQITRIFPRKLPPTHGTRRWDTPKKTNIHLPGSFQSEVAYNQSNPALISLLSYGTVHTIHGHGHEKNPRSKHFLEFIQ